MPYDVRALTPPWSSGGHYSQAIVAGHTVYVAGQTAGAAGSVELASMDLATQTNVAIDRIETLVAKAGGSLADVVKTTCLLANIEDFATFDDAYKKRFASQPPARSTFGVALAPGLLVEIEAVAIIDS